jgi:exosome complex RNA-binding protein Rrp4
MSDSSGAIVRHLALLIMRSSVYACLCVRRLLQPNCAVLQELGKVIPYEIAVGSNGRVWVNSASVAHTVVVANAILSSDGVVPEQA